MSNVRTVSLACAVAGGMIAASAPVMGQTAGGTTTQEAPLATEPLPAQGPGQAAMGSAVQGSAPAPGTSSDLDASAAQEGVTLKPGPAADDMGAAQGQKPGGAAPSQQ